jgi:hypothetical protein
MKTAAKIAKEVKYVPLPAKAYTLAWSTSPRARRAP